MITISSYVARAHSIAIQAQRRFGNQCSISGTPDALAQYRSLKVPTCVSSLWQQFWGWGFV